MPITRCNACSKELYCCLCVGPAPCYLCRTLLGKGGADRSSLHCGEGIHYHTHTHTHGCFLVPPFLLPHPLPHPPATCTKRTLSMATSRWAPSSSSMTDWSRSGQVGLGSILEYAGVYKSMVECSCMYTYGVLYRHLQKPAGVSCWSILLECPEVSCGCALALCCSVS